MVNVVVRGLGRALFYALMAAGVAMMCLASMSYMDMGEAHPFFLEKLPLEHPSLWWVALYLHVPSALFCLPACLFLLNVGHRPKWRTAHRRLGRATGMLVLFAVVPSGMYLALFAQGGWPSTLGFWLTGAITFVAMLKSVQTARRKQWKAHRRYSAHVTAQLSVAVVSRVMLMSAEQAGLYSAWIYIAALWVPVLGCALIAEMSTGTRPFNSSKGRRHENLIATAQLDSLH